jgi:lipid-A-disaccharide synthase
LSVNETHPKKVWILAGEASGDLYGARLAEELQRQSPGVTIQGMGGTAMREAGVDILVDSTELGVVGLVEVLKHYPMFRRIFHDLVARAEAARPDRVVLIDYPGFNLRFAARMKPLGIEVVYYISPQVWAWGKRRIPKTANLLHRMLVIFPFEQQVFADVGLDTVFVGHPLVELMAARRDPLAERDPNLILLLPGSRISEVERLLMPLLETAALLQTQNADFRFVLPTPRPALTQWIETWLAAHPGVADGITLELVTGETEHWMQRAIAGIAASGTVTVQSAILGLPLVVVYKVNPLTYLIGRALVDVPYITMVNLVAEDEVFEEFIQGAVQPPRLCDAIQAILPDGARYAATQAGMATAVDRLQAEGDASVAAAQAVLAP